MRAVDLVTRTLDPFLLWCHEAKVNGDYGGSLAEVNRCNVRLRRPALGGRQGPRPGPGESAGLERGLSDIVYRLLTNATDSDINMAA